MAGNQRQTVWTDLKVDSEIVNLGEARLRLTGSHVANERNNWTLIRLILCLDMFVLAPGGVTGIQSLAIGAGVASEEAFLASIVPNPSISTEFPPRGWIYKCQRAIQDNIDFAAPNQVHIAEDIRTMRRVDNGAAYLVLESDPVSGTAFTIAIQGTVRALFKV